MSKHAGDKDRHKSTKSRFPSQTSALSYWSAGSFSGFIRDSPQRATTLFLVILGMLLRIGLSFDLSVNKFLVKRRT